MRKRRIEDQRPREQSEAAQSAPHNLEAERSIFGAVMIENKVFHAAAAIVPNPSYFYRDAHRRIWQAMIELDEQNRPIELVTMKDQLEANGDLEECGGPAYLASLVDGVPSSMNVRYYADIVKDKAALRGLIKACREISGVAHDADRPAPDILRFGEQKLFELSSGHIPSKMQDLRGGVAKLYKELEFRQMRKGGVTGVDTGYESLNRHTLGWQPGNLIFIGARPSIGKTTFALNSAVAAAQRRKVVAFFSMEMAREELEFRVLSQLSGVELTRILNGALGGGTGAGSDFQKIAEAMEVMSGLPLYIDDQPARTFMDIRSTLRQLEAEHGLDLAVIDYAQLFRGSLDRRGATRNDELTDISNKLKALARELRIPIIVLSQIARRSLHTPDTRPKISDLKDCGAFEQDADVVALLHRRNHEEDGPTEFILAKLRNGSPGSYVLTLRGDVVTFEDGGEMPTAAKDPAPEGAKKVGGKMRRPAPPTDED